MDPELEELAASEVSSSLAFRSITELQSDGKIDAEKAQRWKKKYEELHSALSVILANDRGLLARASDMNRQLQDDMLQLEKLMVRSHQENSELEMLREDSEQAEVECALCREKEQMLGLEDVELVRQRDECQKKIEEIEREHQAALVPVIRGHKDAIEELQARIAEGHLKHEATKKEQEDIHTKIGRLVAESAELAETAERERERLRAMEGVPDKIRKQAETEATVMKGLRVQESRLLDKMREQEIESTKLYDKVRRLTEQFTEASAALERIHVAADQKDRLAADVRKDLEMARLEAEQILADQVQLEQRVQAMAAEAKREGDEHARGIKEKDAVLRKYKKAELDIKQAEGNIPGLVMGREQAARDLTAAQAEHKRHVSAVEELKMETDVQMNAYLKQENVGKEKAAVVQASFLEVEELEKEMEEARAQDKELKAQAGDLASQRERASRLLSVQLSKLREAEEEVKMKELVVADLRQSEADGRKALAEALKLYDLVRTQRSRFVTLAQAAAQGIAEMREKLTILGAEIDILKRSITEKERALADARATHATSLAERDALRQQLQELVADLRAKQVTVDEQISQIDTLSSIINSAEKEMLRLRRAYQGAIEARDAIGVTLIDRSDEIAILYEKANVLDDIFKAGAVELAAREDEIRLLHLELKEARYQADVTKTKCPHVPELHEQIADLKDEVVAEREKVRSLGEALEMPERNSRWKELEGRLPDKAELQVKIGQLEDRISEKKEQILEKGLILDEVTSLSDKLRASVTDGKDGALQLAMEVNSYQHKIRGITRKMMATVSELSLYQAGAIKLQEERTKLAEHVQLAEQKLEAGEAPDESAEREWMRLEREQRTVEEMRIKMEDEKEEEPTYIEGGMRQSRPLHTQAEVRPNAYIPEDEGIPRPYGGHAPFKPLENGSTMRHIRKPEPKPIQI